MKIFRGFLRYVICETGPIFCGMHVEFMQLLRRMHNVIKKIFQDLIVFRNVNSVRFSEAVSK